MSGCADGITPWSASRSEGVVGVKLADRALASFESIYAILTPLAREILDECFVQRSKRMHHLHMLVVCRDNLTRRSHETATCRVCSISHGHERQ